MTYQKAIAFIIKEQKDNLKFKCDFCDLENLSFDEYISHQENDCQSIEVECTACEYSVKRSDFENKDQHWCEKNLKEMILKLRKDLKEGKGVDKEKKEQIERLENYIKDYQRRIDDLQKRKENLEKE